MKVSKLVREGSLEVALISNLQQLLSEQESKQDQIDRVKLRVEKHMRREKCIVRNEFFKSLKAHSAFIGKYFNFVDFLLTFSSLLEDKFQIVNTCLQSDLDQLLPCRLQFLLEPFQLAYLSSSDQEVVRIHVPIHVPAYLQA